MSNNYLERGMDINQTGREEPAQQNEKKQLSKKEENQKKLLSPKFKEENIEDGSVPLYLQFSTKVTFVPIRPCGNSW